MTNYRNLSPGLFPTFLVVLLVHIICHAAGMARDLTPQEKRGKEIYLKGTSPSGQEITARLGNPGVEVPASLLPCVNCHGADGRGKPEGGIIPSDLT